MSGGTPPSPKKKPITNVEKPIKLPDGYDDFSEWRGGEREFPSFMFSPLMLKQKIADHARTVQYLY